MGNKTQKLKLKLKFGLALGITFFIFLVTVGSYWFTQENKSKLRSSAESCPSIWTKILEGNIPGTKAAINNDRWFQLNIDLSTTFGDLERYINEGCSFKVVKLTKPLGPQELESFECSFTGAYRAENVFVCYSPLFSSTGRNLDSIAGGAAFIFDSLRNEVYYMPRLNEADPKSFEISIFVKN